MSERRRAPWAVVALVFAALVPLLWPGDVPFIHDEPQLMAKAVAANAEGRLAPLGLLGTFGVTYGPLPVWMYQALLLVTHDLVPVALAHAALMAFVSAGALWSLARTLGLWPCRQMRRNAAAGHTETQDTPPTPADRSHNGGQR